jgi:hypothetical protein
VESIVDLNQLYFDHQFLLMQAERASCPERRHFHLQDAALVAGRVARMQRAMGARAARSWADAAMVASNWIGRPAHLLFGPPDWRAAKGAGA